MYSLFTAETLAGSAEMLLALFAMLAAGVTMLFSVRA